MFKSDDTGKLVLRLALGILILLHGVAKVTKGVDGIGGMLASHGLPAFLAYGVYVGEILAPALLIVGLFTRPAAVIVAINMLVAIWLVHRKDLGAINGQGGWALELQGMFLFAAISLAFTGGGRFGLSNR
ncbi:DoxX family membrane protein [Variovorax sp. RKNM96]|jgi:putative oxidoreductase|uniref:GntR family transcriptional regulator n=1 Tax=Variovorax paradoxus TaxID=34073 RepID=A0A0D0L0P9_VARPD|nr:MULTISPECIES: DoxX family protein [Variovorax]KIQ22543.1 GntR family transcriptional regulator [Variovorax paradoxus]MCR6475784.1 DoxX family protein [Variovorax sp. ZS18.2.2]QSI30884.1 DoxX family membrane protein [Variovorax sp. RKNM96]